ncbi:GHKL domain-containing protein [Enterococcus alishanensis]|uniref:GHKL domain-containing protein n=1 Tax=Enterococcus alishanensis TaxID=1303817 RepID=A0ABS6TGB2_9ENTE|nr:GHKL domain-containing protein [Enterococcus alishanensis]MBV7391968.1 GHKL domain-containing protein [Enterococcus alishanensis]
MIFKKVSAYSFTIGEFIIYPLMMIGLGLIFSNRFGVWSALLFFVLFILIGLKKEGKFQFIIVFYALYALLMNSFLGYIVAQPFEYLFSTLDFLPRDFLYLSVAVTPAILNYLILAALNHWLPEYAIKSLRQVSNFAMGILTLILASVTGLLYTILTVENQNQAGTWWNNLIIMSLFMVVIFSLLLLNTFYQRQRKQEIHALKEVQLSQLQEYTKHIEALYEEMNHFKHDYINILSSLDDGIREKNMKKITQTYRTVIAPTKQNFQNNHFMIARLSNILVPEIKSLLSAKLLLAKQQNIEVQIEVVAPITEFNMDLLSLIRIISILLDNGIEAAELTENPWLKLAIFEEDDTQIIVIENSSPEMVNIKKIADKGYSSKGMNRGIGLYTVKMLLAETPYVWLETSSETMKFSQVLKIMGDKK